MWLGAIARAGQSGIRTSVSAVPPWFTPLRSICGSWRLRLHYWTATITRKQNGPRRHHNVSQLFRVIRYALKRTSLSHTPFTCCSHDCCSPCFVQLHIPRAIASGSHIRITTSYLTVHSRYRTLVYIPSVQLASYNFSSTLIGFHFLKPSRLCSAHTGCLPVRVEWSME